MLCQGSLRGLWSVHEQQPRPHPRHPDRDSRRSGATSGAASAQFHPDRRNGAVQRRHARPALRSPRHWAHCCSASRAGRLSRDRIRPMLRRADRVDRLALPSAGPRSPSVAPRVASAVLVLHLHHVGTWLLSVFYPRTVDGLVACTRGDPFFPNSWPPTCSTPCCSRVRTDWRLCRARYAAVRLQLRRRSVKRGQASAAGETSGYPEEFTMKSRDSPEYHRSCRITAAQSDPFDLGQECARCTRRRSSFTRVDRLHSRLRDSGPVARFTSASAGSLSAKR